MIPKRYDKFGTVKILTVSRKQWYKNFENPSKFIFIVHPLLLPTFEPHFILLLGEDKTRWCSLQIIQIEDSYLLSNQS